MFRGKVRRKGEKKEGKKEGRKEVDTADRRKREQRKVFMNVLK